MTSTQKSVASVISTAMLLLAVGATVLRHFRRYLGAVFLFMAAIGSEFNWGDAYLNFFTPLSPSATPLANG